MASVEFAWRVTKCHACHALGTLSPLLSANIAIYKKTRNTPRLKCCACHAKWDQRCPKCCACHEKCNTSPENVAKVLRLPHKTMKHLGMSQSATPATETTWQPVLKHSTKMGFAVSPFPHRHCDGSKEASDSRRDMLEHRARLPYISDFAASKSTFSYSFVTNRPQNRRFVRRFRRFLSPVTKCHACHGICTLSPIHAALTMRSQKTRSTRRRKCCACHATWHRRCPKCCACHEKCNASLENVAEAVRLPHKTIFDASWNMLECQEVPRLPREMKLRNAGKPQKWPLWQNFLYKHGHTSYRHGHTALTRTLASGCRRLWTVANGCERLRTVANGCGRKRDVRRTQLYPHTPRVKWEPLLRIREKPSFTNTYSMWG